MGKEINYLVMAILLIGMALLLGGGYGLYSIRQAEKAYESTVGIVKRVDYKRVHRHRKVLGNDLVIHEKSSVFKDIFTET